MAVHTLDEVNWPALSFGEPHYSLMRHNSPSALNCLSRATQRVMSGLTQHFIIDSTGMRIDLSNPEFTDGVSGLPGIVYSLLGRKRPVRWQCTERGVVDVAELKNLIQNDWRNYETMWEGLDLDDLRQRLSAATTVSAVIEVFS
jgi:hypothetical protein